MKPTPLPVPWVRGSQVEFVSELEHLVGAGESSDLPLDVSWVQVRNTETGQVVLLRLQEQRSGAVKVTAVIFPFSENHSLSGADLRDLPLTAIAAAFSNDLMRRLASIMKKAALHGLADGEVGSSPPGPMEPLPNPGSSMRFLALVAQQYEALEAKDPARNPVEAMAELNGRPASTVRRWLGNARAAGLLPPPMPKRS